jgi:ribosome-binding protein aMBF1 (putative translation factor)
MTPEQCRQARDLLGWKPQRLAGQSSTSDSSIRKYEGRRGELRQATVAAIRTALEAGGVEFIAENGGGAGVRLRHTQSGSG